MLPTHAPGWNAGLDLRFSRRAPSAAANVSAPARTILHHREHVGPLMVQKPLYPEGPEVCHVALLHPPAGMVGGDSLRVDARLEPRARALLLTPGATQWYRSTGRKAAQQWAGFGVKGRIGRSMCHRERPEPCLSAGATMGPINARVHSFQAIMPAERLPSPANRTFRRGNRTFSCES